MNKKNNSDVCIIVATFNRAALLKETLESLVNQTHPAEKIIVVDDGSADNTREVVAGFGKSIEYIFQENGGKPSAINRALQYTDAEYIWVFDDDDIALPHALEKLLAPLKENPELYFSHGGISFFKVDGQGNKVTIINPEINYITPGQHFETLLMGCGMCHIATLIKKECYDTLEGIDENLRRCEDYDFLLRLTRQFKGINVTQKIIKCRSHGGDRGDLLHRHSAAERDKIHFHYDQLFFAKLRKETPITAYIGKTNSDILSDQDYFNAWFNRATSMGVHGLWQEYLEDILWCQKYNEDKHCFLTSEQNLKISSCFSMHYAIEKGREIKGFPYIAINQTIRALGKGVIKPIARGFYWSIRKDAKHKMAFFTKPRYLFYILYVVFKKVEVK